MLSLRKTGMALLLASIVFLSVFSFRSQSQSPNLLTDPGFESGNPDRWTPRPGTTRFTLTQTHVFSGAFAAAIISDGSTATKSIIQNIPNIIENTEYTLSGYLLKNDPAVKKTRLRVAWYATDDCSGSQLSTADTPDLTADDPDFLRLERAATAPTGTHCAQIRIQLQPVDAGRATIYADNLGFAQIIAPTPQPSPTPAPVVPLLISEVFYDAHTPSTSGDEFVEICNPTEQLAILTGYKIGDEETRGKGEGMYRFPVGASLAPADCLIVAKNAAQFQLQFGLLPQFELIAAAKGYTDTESVPNLSRYSAWASGNWALSNTGDEVLLLSPDDQIVDAVAYENGNYASVGVTPAARASAPFSLQRIFTADSDRMTFDFLRDNPTPGAITPAPAPSAPSPPVFVADQRLFLGTLNAKSTLSFGTAPPAYLFSRAQNAGLTFAALADFTENLSPQNWTAVQSDTARANLGGQFVALAAFEWQGEGKTAQVFGMDAPITPTTFADFSDTLAQNPTAFVQINDTFADIPFSPKLDSQVALFALNATAPAASLSVLRSLWAKGWHFAPTLNFGLTAPTWGANDAGRTGILAPELTQSALMENLRARKTLATTADDLLPALRIGGHWMGNVDLAAGESTAHIFVPRVTGAMTVTLFDGDVPISEAIFTTPMTQTLPITLRAGHYYWAKAIRTTGDFAVTAPLWVLGARQPDRILLNEILPAPAETESEWIELLNPTEFPVNLQGWKIGDRTEKRFTFQGDTLILPHAFLSVSRQESGIALNNSGDDVRLFRADGSSADVMTYDQNPGADKSVCRQRNGGKWAKPCIPTPNAANIVLPPPAPLALNIWDAKHVTEGAWVKIDGFVTVPTGAFGDNTLYLQDDTHGIRVKLPSKHGRVFKIGDHLGITGYLDLYYNEWEIDVKDMGDVTLFADKGFVPPLPIKSGMLSEGYEGLLVQLSAVPVALKEGSVSFWADDGTGWAYIYVYGSNGIYRKNITLGTPMTIVGVASQRTQLNPPQDGYRLLPRATFDLQSQLSPPVPPGFPSLLPNTGAR